MQTILVSSVKKSNDCIQQVFYEYERLTKRSEKKDKTEILNLNSEEQDEISFRYNDQSFVINTVEKN